MCFFFIIKKIISINYSCSCSCICLMRSFATLSMHLSCWLVFRAFVIFSIYFQLHFNIFIFNSQIMAMCRICIKCIERLAIQNCIIPEFTFLIRAHHVFTSYIFHFIYLFFNQFDCISVHFSALKFHINIWLFVFILSIFKTCLQSRSTTILKRDNKKLITN